MKKNITLIVIMFVLFFVSVFPVSASQTNTGNGQWLAIGKTNKLTCAWNNINRAICLSKIPNGTTVYIIQVAGTYVYYVKYLNTTLNSLIGTWVNVSDVQILYYCNYTKTPLRCSDYTK